MNWSQYHEDYMKPQKFETMNAPKKETVIYVELPKADRVYINNIGCLRYELGPLSGPVMSTIDTYLGDYEVSEYKDGRIVLVLKTITPKKEEPNANATFIKRDKEDEEKLNKMLKKLDKSKKKQENSAHSFTDKRQYFFNLFNDFLTMYHDNGTDSKRDIIDRYLDSSPLLNRQPSVTEESQVDLLTELENDIREALDQANGHMGGADDVMIQIRKFTIVRKP